MKQDQAGIEKFIDGLLSAYLMKYNDRADFENSLKVMAPLFERAASYEYLDDAEIVSIGLKKFDEAIKIKSLN